VDKFPVFFRKLRTPVLQIAIPRMSLEQALLETLRFQI
jgi:hypothetical protein